ncbi:MAG: hypothetical protein ACO20H_09475 [Bacteriovoracaceae bacterium]
MSFKKTVTMGVLSLGISLGAQAASCPTGTTSLGEINGFNTCALKGKYTQDVTLTSDNRYVLQGGVFIGNDNKNNSTLSIQPGTVLYGQSGADFLVVTRGSKLIAEGTKEAPIRFTAAKDSGRRRGEWGGLIINGNAPINSCKTETTAFCEAEGEGSTGLYGGTDAMDNSGVLKYVVVEFAGYEITPDNELNGIAFQGVGAGTTVDYIQVHMNADDGVEFFGGTVNAKHIVLTGNKDDSLDWTSGYTGNIQYVVVEQYDDQGNNGIEADNLKSPMNAQPRSNPTLSNMTFIGTSSSAAKGGNGILLRRGSGAQVYNTILTGFKKSCIDFDDEETFQNGGNVNSDSSVTAMGIRFESVIVDCNKNFTLVERNRSGEIVNEPWRIDNFFFSQLGNMNVDPMLKGYMPQAGSPALGAGVTPMDLFFDEVDYIGAMKDYDWTAGWTTHARD